MPYSAKNGSFGVGFLNLSPDFPPKCKDFDPPDALTLHLFGKIRAEILSRYRFSIYSVSPNYLSFIRSSINFHPHYRASNNWS